MALSTQTVSQAWPSHQAVADIVHFYQVPVSFKLSMLAIATQTSVAYTKH